MTEITYTRQGDYNLPNLLPPQEEPGSPWEIRIASEEVPQGAPQVTYTNLLTSGKLNSHLAETSRPPAPDEEIVAQMAKARGRDGGTESQRPDEMGGG